MTPGKGPGPSGQAIKLGHGPYFVVTTTSCSYMGRSLVELIGGGNGARSLARSRPDVYWPLNTGLLFSDQALSASAWSSEAEQPVRAAASASRSSRPAATSLIARLMPASASGALAARVAASASTRAAN